jgi:hypothetical protein
VQHPTFGVYLALGLMQEPSSYRASWADYRRRQWLAVLVPVALAPVAALAGSAATNQTLSLLPAIGWFVCSFWAISRFIWFCCPRCGHRFHINQHLSLTLGKECPHCGLVRYEAA